MKYLSVTKAFMKFSFVDKIRVIWYNILDTIIGSGGKIYEHR